MSKVILIGAGGVGTVVAHKMAQNAEVFTDILIASRTKASDKPDDTSIPKISATVETGGRYCKQP